MNRCADCKHWDRAPGKDMGSCDALMGVKSDRGGWGVFAAEGEAGKRFHPIVCNLIGTEADFGCTLWEARDEQM